MVSSIVRKTVSSGNPWATLAAHLVCAWATGLRNVIRPTESVAITASPMLERVVRKRSRSAANSAFARDRA